MFSDNSSGNSFSVSDSTINNSAAVLADMNTNIVAIITAINNISDGSSIADIVTALNNLNTSLGNINVSLGIVNTSINTVNSTLTTANTNTNNIHNDLFLTTGTALNASVIGGLQNISGGIGQIQQELQAGIDPITSNPVNIAQSLINVHNDLNNYVSGSPGIYTSVGQSAFTINQALYNTGDTAKISDVLTAALLRTDYNLTASANVNNLLGINQAMYSTGDNAAITDVLNAAYLRNDFNLAASANANNLLAIGSNIGIFSSDDKFGDQTPPFSLNQILGIYFMGDPLTPTYYNATGGNAFSVDGV